MSNTPSAELLNDSPCFESQGSWSEGYALAKNSGAGVSVGPGTDNPNTFGQLFPVEAVRHFRLVARARVLFKDSGKGQFQVNWTDRDGRFISTSQQHFDVTATESRYECRVQAPDAAVAGVIYVAPGSEDDVLQYFEMSLHADFAAAAAVISDPVPRFPTNLLHLSDPANWSQFGNLFRGYDDEPIFKEMIRKVVTHTMVTYDGLLGLLSMVRFCETCDVAGDYVEIGCWRGGCAGLMALGAQRYGKGGRQIRVFDSFQGLPQPIAGKDFDGHLEPMFELDASNSRGKLDPINQLVAAEDDVRELLIDQIGYPQDRLSIHKGWFQDTIPAATASIKGIAILRLDGDLYDSYVVALEHLFPKVVKGGFVIIDDWVLGGCRKAVAEYFAQQGLKPYLWTLDATTRCFQRT